MVVEATLRAALRVRATPHAHVQRVNGGRCAFGWKRIADEQAPQSFGVDSPLPERGIQAAPSATMHRLQAQVHRRGDYAGCEDGVGEFEERVGVAIEAAVERLAEGV